MLWWLLAAQWIAADVPKFEEYPVREAFRGPSAPLRLVTAEQHRYRTRIIEGLSRGPNFAGHHTAIIFGCGSNCGMMFLVDLRTGVVYKPPRAINGSMLPMASMIGPEVEFRKDSSLFRVKDCEDFRKQSCFQYSFQWRDMRWKLLHKLPIPPQQQ